MRKITYVCDRCKREYPYELKYEDSDRGILARVDILKQEL